MIVGQIDTFQAGRACPMMKNMYHVSWGSNVGATWDPTVRNNDNHLDKMTWGFYSECRKMWQKEEHWATLIVLGYRASHRTLLWRVLSSAPAVQRGKTSPKRPGWFLMTHRTAWTATRFPLVLGFFSCYAEEPEYSE